MTDLKSTFKINRLTGSILGSIFTALLFFRLTGGAFLMDRELYNALSANARLHHGLHIVCTLLLVGLLVMFQKLHGATAATIYPVKLFYSFFSARPAISLGFLFFTYLATQFICLWAMHGGLGTALWDFGFNDNVIWNTAHGKVLMLSVRGGQNALGEHFTPIFILLAPLYWITQQPESLFFLQSLLLAACIPFLYGISRRLLLDHETALCLSLAAFFYLPLRSGILFPFQIQTFADPLLLAGFYCILSSKKLGGMVLLGLALMCKENIVMEVLGIGLFLIASKRKIGWGVTALSLATLFLNTRIIEPMFSFDYQWNKWGYYSHITHPSLQGWVSWAHSFFSAQTLIFLTSVFAPLLFLPFFAKNWFWLLGPTLAVRLLTPFAGFRIITAHYTAGLNALLFIASAYALLRLPEGPVGRLCKFLLKNQPLSTLTLRRILQGGILGLSLLFAGIPQLFKMEGLIWEASSPSNQRIVKMLRSVPSSYSVMATQVFLAQMTHRHYIFGFDTVMPGSPLEARAEQPDFLAVDQGRIQTNENLKLQQLLANGYIEFFHFDFMKVWVRTDLFNTQKIQELRGKWTAIEQSKSIPYRKLIRKYYRYAIIVLVSAYFWGTLNHFRKKAGTTQ